MNSVSLFFFWVSLAANAFFVIYWFTSSSKKSKVVKKVPKPDKTEHEYLGEFLNAMCIHDKHFKVFNFYGTNRQMEFFSKMQNASANFVTFDAFLEYKSLYFTDKFIYLSFPGTPTLINCYKNKEGLKNFIVAYVKHVLELDDPMSYTNMTKKYCLDIKSYV